MALIPADNRFGAFRHQSYRLFFLARFLGAFAIQIVSVAVGWQMYEETGSALYLGLIGLFQFLPSLVLILVTGTVADRYNRRAIMASCLFLAAISGASLLTITVTDSFVPWLVFFVLLVFGIERAFMGPAVQSLAPSLVPKDDLPNAIAWNSSSWQLASIIGPVGGGLLYGLSPVVAYTVATSFFTVAGILVIAIKKPAQKEYSRTVTLESLLAGFKFISNEKVVLGAISLDLFAVLLGGAVALMPIFAKEVLTLGPWGLGLLRSAPGLGAIVVAILLAFYPIRKHAGLMMFVGVALFGVATVVFGLSQTAWLSIAALMVLGGADMISVYVRETLIALWTPDEVRGRVNAVNMVFVGASNELGEFRAGTMASVTGAVPAVVIGGIGTIAVSIIWAMKFPKLRKIDNLDAPSHL
jgi:MFS family permease